jgi:hypothetical protein
MRELCCKQSQTENMTKTNEKKFNTPDERFYIDISSIKAVSKGGAKCWALVADKAI